MSLLSDENIINLDFKKGIELLNLQEKSKIEQIFSRVLEYETRIRIEPQLKNAEVFNNTELQQLCPILNKVETTDGTGTVITQFMNAQLHSMYSQHPKTGRSGFRAVIFRTLFESGFRMVAILF
jgi:hypothetical protein